MFVIPAVCQKKNEITYKTVQTEIYFKDQNNTDSGGKLLDFRGDYIMTTFSDQTKKIYLQEPWEEYTLMGENVNIRSWRAQAKDSGGFYCYLNYGFDPKSELFFLVISYTNVKFLHWMEPSEEYMWDKLDILPPHDVPDHIEWTQAELDQFWNSFKFLMINFYSLSWTDR